MPSKRKKKKPPQKRRATVQTDGHLRFDTYLRERRLTVDAAAAAFGVSRSYISMIRRARTSPGLAMATRIEKLTGIPCRAWDEAPDVAEAVI
jgi:transcriptional regulator with XRE-family HTH domain